MAEQSGSDFWTGAFIGTAVGALGFFLFSKFSPAIDNSSLPSQSQVVVMDGTTPSVSLHVGDALTIRAQNGNFTSMQVTGDAVFDASGASGIPQQLFHATAAGTATITTTDAGGVQTTLTVTVS